MTKKFAGIRCISFGFDGENMFKISVTDEDMMNPAFIKVAEIA